jgi:hypothetical protein
VRGASTPRKSDGIHRAAQRGDSTHYQDRVRTVASDLVRGGVRPEPGHATLARTREEVIDGWRGIADLLDSHGRQDHANAIRKFAARLPPVRTEKQWIGDQLLQSLQRSRSMERPELSR